MTTGKHFRQLLTVVAVALGLVVVPTVSTPVAAHAAEALPAVEEAATEPAPEPEPDPTCSSVGFKGTAKVGYTVTAVPKCQDGAKPEFTWYSGDDRIKGQTANAIEMVPKYAGKKLRVVVTAGTDTVERSTNNNVRPGTLSKKSATIVGKRQVGRILEVKRGTWSPTPEYSYQWYQRVKDGKKVGKWTKIKGATGKKYTLKAAQRGKDIRVVVTGTKSGYDTATATSKWIGPVNSGQLLNTKPKIKGTAKVGKTLSAIKGKSTTGTKFTYRWYADGKQIPKATKSKYKLKSAQVGKRITVKVTRSKAGYKTVSNTSKATKKVLGNKLKKGTPSFTGTISTGNYLTANPGTWTSGTKLSYQWQACGKNIKGATGRTHIMSSKDLNCRIRVKVTGKKAGYTTASATSKTKGIRWRVSSGTQPNLKNYKNLSIVVSTSKQRVYIKSSGKTIYTMLTSTGTNSTPTVKGNFRIQGRGPMFMNPDGVGARYWVRFYGEYLFHSIPIYSNGQYSASMGAQLGQKASHGCVRLPVADSIWFYNQIPTGTKVTVY